MSSFKYVTVLPYVYKPYFDEFMELWEKRPEGILLYLDNTKDNLGVAESWNQGIDFMFKMGVEWLIVCSAAIRFGKNGVKQMYEQLEAHPEADIVHFATKEVPEQFYVRGKSPGYADGVLGWHLTAINKRVIQNVGKFDSNFYPMYFEDIDYDLRVNKFYGDKKDWLILPIDAGGSTIGHSVALAGIQAPADPLIAYFATKWGRHPSAAQLGDYEYPFNNPENSIAFFPPAHGRQWND